MFSFAGFLNWVRTWIVAIIIVVIIVVTVIVAYNIHVHMVAADAAAPAKAQAAVSQADVKSGQAAVNTTEDVAKESDKTDDTTRKNNVVIIHEPGASVTLDPALDTAGRVAICMRESTSGFLECKSLLKLNSK